MRIIKVDNWHETVNGKETETNILVAINVLLGLKESQMTGYSNFRTFARIASALDKADSTGVLELEEADYEFLKKKIDQNVPAAWAFNEKAVNAFDAFMNVPDKK